MLLSMRLLRRQASPTTGETSAPPAPKLQTTGSQEGNQERVKSSSLLAIQINTSSKFQQYHNLWDVIVNGDLEEEPTPTTGETFAPPAPKTAKQLAARRNQERVKSILLLVIFDEYLLKFHSVADANSLGEIYNRDLVRNWIFVEVAYVDCHSKEVHSRKRAFSFNINEYGLQRINDPFLLDMSKIEVLQWHGMAQDGPVSTARQSINTVRPVSTARPSINTARHVSTASPNISIARPGYASRPIYPRMDNVKPRGSCSLLRGLSTQTRALGPQILKTKMLRELPGSCVQRTMDHHAHKKVEYIDPKGFLRLMDLDP
ncbi:hypothetical protein Tco_1533512 [Tanacetum coccineum]